MPFRKYAFIPDDPNFREALVLWARKFAKSEAVAKRLAQRTIDVLCDNPSLLDGRDINEAIFKLLRRHAFDENELSSGQGSQGDGVVSEKEPTW
ncbi:hypothetical protein FP026_07690 [Rhizobium tropici]|uniref:Uncharacterized protein n=1 Tax=Rhizobium tropici TaxID=398 RepID=A0A5B0WA48_RHITR|nr:hypothetical protein [Rhizobium tropici]KAA1183894.1 hypothetical protein FP026_07690 [Rhizobium tropici]